MKPILIKLWTDKSVGIMPQTIRANFSNDRHYEVVVRRPCNSEEVARALFDMAQMIANDPNLKGLTE